MTCFQMYSVCTVKSTLDSTWTATGQQLVVIASFLKQSGWHPSFTENCSGIAGSCSFIDLYAASQLCTCSGAEPHDWTFSAARCASAVAAASHRHPLTLDVTWRRIPPRCRPCSAGLQSSSVCMLWSSFRVYVEKVCQISLVKLACHNHCKHRGSIEACWELSPERWVGMGP